MTFNQLLSLLNNLESRVRYLIGNDPTNGDLYTSNKEYKKLYILSKSLFTTYPILEKKLAIIKQLIDRLSSMVCCGFSILTLKTFLSTNTSSYPVGVFNIDGDYLGIATDQTNYISTWNSDLSNQTQGTLSAGTTQFTFKITNSATITQVTGLRYYEYKGPANMQIFVGNNDIVHYGSTIKKGNVDGLSISTATRREWNRNLYTGIYKSTIPTDTVRTLTCTGYTDNSLMQVFHNEDSKYAAVSGSFGFYRITGNLPKAINAVFWSGRLLTQYNDILNWSELTSLFSWYCFSSGGTVWGFDPSTFPSTLNKSLLTQLAVGQFTSSSGPLSTDYSFITATAFPILQDCVITYNTGDALTGSESWFLTMPKVTNYFRYETQTATQVSAAVADDIWNNVATALTGITASGAAKQIRIQRTNNITAASLTARNYLIAQGWTVTTN